MASKGEALAPEIREAGYRCCCGCMHVERGALVIAGFSAAFTTIHLFFSALTIGHEPMAVVKALWYAFQLACCISLIVGVQRRLPKLMLPYAGLLAFATTAALVMALLLGVGAVWTVSPAAVWAWDFVRERVKERGEGMEGHIETVVAVSCGISSIVCLLSAAFSYWWLSVTLACRRYITDLLDFGVVATAAEKATLDSLA